MYTWRMQLQTRGHNNIEITLNFLLRILHNNNITYYIIFLSEIIVNAPAAVVKNVQCVYHYTNEHL